MAVLSTSGALAAGTPVTVTLTGGSTRVEVLNRTASTEIWVRYDGTPAAVGADECLCVIGVGSQVVPAPGGKVSIISSATPNYTVQAL